MAKQRSDSYHLGRILGLFAGYLTAQQAWALYQLFKCDVVKTLQSPLDPAPPHKPFSETTETETYIRQHTLEDGIERIVYTPQVRRHTTPIVMQHGMWHGAWTWELWQKRLAELGWETHAHSLPGHGRSPVRRPIARCTLDYYLAFLKAEIDRLPTRPVLMGHSMGGALTQWYLKYVDNDLPAAIPVAPWTSHSMFKDGTLRLIAYDPIGILMMLKTWDATPLVRPGPGSGARFLAGPNAVIPLDEITRRLGPESTLVLYQHNPPFWYPPTQIRAPLLWVAGEDDPLLVEPAQRRSADFYHADYYVAPKARHNVMMEHNYLETVEAIHTWLERKNIN